MNTFTINAALVRAAQACQADKTDTRYYLQGFLVSANGDVVGTNGHVLFKGKDSGIAPTEDVIIQIDGKIPVSADSVTFSDGVCRTDTGKVFGYKVVDGTFPQYQRVIPERNRTEHSNGFGCQVKYLARALAVFGKEATVNVYTATENDSILMEYAGKDTALFLSVLVVMPCRTEASFEKLYMMEQAVAA